MGLLLVLRFSNCCWSGPRPWRCCRRCRHEDLPPMQPQKPRQRTRRCRRRQRWQAECAGLLLERPKVAALRHTAPWLRAELWPFLKRAAGFAQAPIGFARTPPIAACTRTPDTRTPQMVYATSPRGRKKTHPGELRTAPQQPPEPRPNVPEPGHLCRRSRPFAPVRFRCRHPTPPPLRLAAL